MILTQGATREYMGSGGGGRPAYLNFWSPTWRQLKKEELLQRRCWKIRRGGER